MNNILDLKGKVALVTGAGQGVGKQIALHFAEHNAKAIIINDYNMEKAESTATLIKNHYKSVNVIAVEGDVSKWQSVNTLVADALKQFESIDILVNNAGNAGASSSNGIVTQKKFIETSPEEWERWIGVNFYGPMYTTRAILPTMIANNYGKIVNVISDAGRVGEAKLAVYSGAKAGAAGFTRAIAREVGAYNITANCVALSAINTAAISVFTENEEIMRKVLKNYPLNRIGEPVDAANAVLFLSSDASSWVTGQTYPVNGGFSFNL